MRIKRESKKYIWIEFNGKVIRTERNSLTHRLLEFLKNYLEEKEIKAFRTIEISQYLQIPTKKISWTLYKLWKKGILEKTKKKLVFLDSTNLEHVWGLTQRDIILYVLSKLEKEERKEFLQLFKQVLEKDVISSKEACQIVRNLSGWDYIFVEVLELVKKVKTDIMTFYVNPKAPKERVDSIIRIKLSEVLAELKENIRRGLKFEEWVYRFFEQNKEKIHFKLVAIERRKRVKIGEKIRIFDLVLYFKLYIGEKPLEYVPLLVVPIEVKDQATGQFYLVTHLLDCQQAFSHNFIPTIITSKPRKSAFDVSGHLKVGLVTERDLKKVMEGEGEDGREPELGQPLSKYSKKPRS